MNTAAKVVAIIVTYRPDLAALDALVAAVTEQVSAVVIVDNGSDSGQLADRYADSRVRFLPLKMNRGVAAAQNIGIRVARRRRASYVLMLDQDSLPAGDMVAELVRAISRLPDAACVGPRYVDPRQNNAPPFIRIEGLRLRRCLCDSDEAVVPVDYLVSSGCLIPMAALDAVGGPRDDLFIDYVDIEWGLRARRHGLQSYGVCSARMRHSLGEAPIRRFGRCIPLHSPLRHYYHFRNAVLVSREPWIPFNWKIVDLFRLCRKYVFYSLFTRTRSAHWRMMTLGLWHGLRGRSGRLQGGVL